MNARSLARLLVVAALACAGSFLLGGYASAQDGTTVQNGNDSEGSTATSAPVTAGNSTTMQSGPAAQDGGNASMVGDTNTTTNQDNRAASGPASAGSQFSNPSNGSTEQNNNSSVGATAESGPVQSFQSIDAHNGPYASGDGANASMVGDGDLDISQSADAESGPADAGTQRTASDDAVVQNSNTCGDAVTDCGTASSGPVFLENVFGDSTDPAFPAPSGTGPVAISNSGDPVTAALVGDADAVITQAADAVSGSATLGSQDTDVTGGTVQNDNTAANGFAASGPVAVLNFGVAFVGPVAQASSTASSVQVGDASGDLDMSVAGASGNAVTGSQVTAATGDRAGALTVQNRSASEDDTAVTGAAEALSSVFAIAGPAASALFGNNADAGLVGDASFDIVTEGDALSGDAWAGSQNTTAEDAATVQNDNDSFAGIATSGDAVAAIDANVISGPTAIAIGDDATATQEGDDEAEVDLTASAESGEASVGSQDTDASGDATVQNGNVSDTDIATSGLSESLVDTQLFAGPLALAFSDAVTASQVGDNAADVVASADSLSGDAAAGSQTTEASDDATVQNHNDSLFNDALSGDALAGDALFGVAGPVALVGDSRAVQEGDNELGIDQAALAVSGDAASGVQSSAASDEATVQNGNLTDTSFATSATACASPVCVGEITDAGGTTVLVPGGNAADVVSGPVATGPGSSDAALDGDTQADLRQTAIATTGDATASSQVDDASGDSTVQNDNVSTGAVAGCFFPDDCAAVAGNEAAAVVGPFASADAGFIATADQVGDSELNAGRSQTAEAHGGDSIAGSQFTDADDSTVQNGNDATNATAEAGPVTAWTGLGIDPFDATSDANRLIVGAAAIAETADASAALEGDASLDVDLEVVGESGDAISGTQVTDVEDTTVQVDNVSVDDTALSGPVSGFAFGGGVVGPFGHDGDAAQVGDAGADIVSVVDVASGDAISGSQLITNAGVAAFALDAEIAALADLGDAFGTEGSEAGFGWSSGGFVGHGLTAETA